MPAGQWAAVENSFEVAQAVLDHAFENSPDQAAELFPEEQLDVRLQVLAHKLIDYAAHAEVTEQEIAGTSTIADALIELAPSRYADGSRRQRKAQKALDEWFDLEHEGRRVIGASVASVIDHHERRTLQQIGELRNRYLSSETEAPELLFTTQEGLELYRLSTKAHLEGESAVTYHCVGTSSLYSDRLAAGREFFFSLRNPASAEDDPFRYTTIQYDVERNRVVQVRGFRNKAVSFDSPHIISVVESLAHIRDNVLQISPEDFTVLDIGQGMVDDINLGTLQEFFSDTLRILNEMKSGIMFKLQVRRVHINEAFDPEVIDDEIRDILQACEIREFVFANTDAQALAKIVEGVGAFTGDLTFSLLETAQGLEALPRVEGSINFPALLSSAGLDSLEEIGGNANFPVLTDASGLGSLRKIGGDANFGSLVTAVGLTELRRVGGSVVAPALQESEGLESLREVSSDVRLPVLTDASGLTALEEIGGRAFFGKLESSRGLSFLRRIGKGAHFMVLKEAKSLTSLEYIGARAHFEELTSAIGLERLEHIGGRAYFSSLPTAEGLEGVKYVGSYVYADVMRREDRGKLRRHIPSKAERKKRRRR